MEQTKFNGEIMLLCGKEAIVIPCLAMIGAASIMGAIGYGVHKLRTKVGTKVIERHKKIES